MINYIRCKIFISFIVSLIILPSWCGAQERIAFSRLTGDNWQIWTMDPDGANREQITFSSFDKRDPTWCRRGGSIAYRTNNGQLFIADLKGKEEKQIFRKYNQINNPCCSSDGEEIIFVRYLPMAIDRSAIWKANLSDHKPLLVTKDNKLTYQPTFSQDGKTIAYVQADENVLYHHIWLMDADGANRRQLTFGEGFETLPNFHPNNREVAFSSNRMGDYEIYVQDVGKKKPRQLTRHQGLDSSPCFSPDGKQVAFVSNRSGKQQIWIMDRDGLNPHVISEGEGESVDPAWIKLPERIEEITP